MKHGANINKKYAVEHPLENIKINEVGRGWGESLCSHKYDRLLTFKYVRENSQKSQRKS